MGIKLCGISFFLCVLTGGLSAQLCTGSLGDPIINISFGQGTNPGNPLLAATTSYQYSSSDCPADGYYTVRNNTSGCFGSSWHNVTADHTGNPDGYFMLVNASYQPGDFYLDTVKNLCENTTYEFAAWMMNVLMPASCSGSGIQPNITLSIERTNGTVLQSYNTGNIATASSPQWHQYGSFFTTPASVTNIVLRMTNNAPGGCGNDIALDDIIFRPCGPTIAETIDGLTGSTVSYCEGPARQLLLGCALSGGFTNPEFQWHRRDPSQPNWANIPGATSDNYLANFIANASPGNYQFRLAVAEFGNMVSPSCRVYSAVFTVTVNAKPVTTANNNGPACSGTSLVLSASGGTQYAWDGPTGFTATGTAVTMNNIQLSQAGKYYVTVSSAAGCMNRDSTTIIVNPVPTAVTGFPRATICEGDTAQLSASGGIDYQWIPVAGLSGTTIPDPKAFPAGTTLYSVIVSNAYSCKDTATVTVDVIPNPTAHAGPDKIIFEGQSVSLSGSVNGPGNNYYWSPGDHISDIHSLHPVVDPPADQYYTLTVVSDSGCGTTSDIVLVKVFKDIFIPTAFTPNNDGLNDRWTILGLDALLSYRVTVYNRWGQPIFQTTDTPRSWDGTYNGVPSPAGVYVYIIEKRIDRKLVKGTVMLIR